MRHQSLEWIAATVYSEYDVLGESNIWFVTGEKKYFACLHVWKISSVVKKSFMVKLSAPLNQTRSQERTHPCFASMSSSFFSHFAFTWHGKVWLDDGTFQERIDAPCLSRWVSLCAKCSQYTWKLTFPPSTAWWLYLFVHETNLGSARDLEVKVDWHLQILCNKFRRLRKRSETFLTVFPLLF